MCATALYALHVSPGGYGVWAVALYASVCVQCVWQWRLGGLEAAACDCLEVLFGDGKSVTLDTGFGTR